MTNSGRTAVVLFQLGGPDSPEAVEPFLYNLFLDPDIIDFPFASMAREPLARYISSHRSRKVIEKYKEIGGKSPIFDLTQQLARALERELGKDADVLIAMRYWHPMTESVVRLLAQGQRRPIVLLPLYPQYSKTTTGSSLNEWKRCCSAFDLDLSSQKIVRHFYDHPLYIEAVVSRINEGLAKFSEREREAVALLFSAHGVPMSVISSGDPYKDHIEQTVRLVMRAGQWPNVHLLCYQSKVGWAKWLRPSLDETIRALAAQGVRDVLVVPIAFVSDHIETLHEIDIEARQLAGLVGIRQFVLMPALNAHPRFVQALADLVRLKLTNEGAGEFPA